MVRPLVRNDSCRHSGAPRTTELSAPSAGRYDEARADLRKAITLTRRSGEVLWEARARTAAALAVGATARAEAGFLAAESLFDGTGQRLEIAYARQNLALVAFAAGDLPGRCATSTTQPAATPSSA
jgi:hypothetical protein